MPPKGFVKSEPVDQRLKVGLSAADHMAISECAHAANMTTAAYVRQIIQFHLGEVSKPPRPRSDSDALALLAEVHLLAMQIKRVGVNVNQMARQANTGLVPLTPAELQVTQSEISDAMRQAVALFDKVVAK